MMRSKNLFGWGLAILFLLASCKKKEGNEPTGYNVPDQIIFGEYENLGAYIHKMDPPLVLDKGPDQGSESYELDITSDGRTDIEFFVMNSTSSDWISRVSTFGSWNDSVQFLVKAFKDTNFLSTDWQNPEIPKTFDRLEYNSLSGFSSLSENDQIIGISEVYVFSSFVESKILNLDDPDLLWQGSSSFAYLYKTNPNKKATRYSYSGIDFSDNFTNKYIVYRIKNGDKPQYGWIKIGAAGLSRVEVLEYSYFTKIAYETYL